VRRESECLQVLDPALEADFNTLRSFKGPDADLWVEATSNDGSVWLVAYSKDNAATEYYVYDRCAPGSLQPRIRLNVSRSCNCQ
jgi:hypothetical protein